MSVSRKLLALKSDQELFSYIEENNRYVPEANQIAFEILQKRGHVFDPPESNRIRQQIINKEASEEPFIHPHHVSAGNIIYFSVILGFVQLFINYDIITSNSNLWLDLLGLGLFFLLGFYAKRGSQSVKYLFALFFLLGLAGVIDLIVKNQMNPLFNLIALVQCALQIWAVVLLFRVPRQFNN